MRFHTWILILSLLLFPVLALGQDETPLSSNRVVLVYITTALLLVTTPQMFGFGQREGHHSPHIERKRRPVSSIFRELGPTYVRRAYRMSEHDFWQLHRLIRPYLGITFQPPYSFPPPLASSFGFMARQQFLRCSEIFGSDHCCLPLARTSLLARVARSYRSSHGKY